jgi:acyl carrier protein
MTSEQIFDEVAEICKQTFGDPNLNITPETSAKDVENWDSMTNLILIDSLEKRFEITFSLDDIMNAANIGDLVKVISKGR